MTTAKYPRSIPPKNRLSRSQIPDRRPMQAPPNACSMLSYPSMERPICPTGSTASEPPPRRSSTRGASLTDSTAPRTSPQTPATRASRSGAPRVTPPVARTSGSPTGNLDPAGPGVSETPLARGRAASFGEKRPPHGLGRGIKCHVRTHASAARPTAGIRGTTGGENGTWERARARFESPASRLLRFGV